ncbi:MAG: hypothetical protein NZM43_06110 [Saprospiraceae bacterium]|nr:hypothetical protein [Saprospiraceae bacterium]MDW8483884.1 hypothetical protein [Saprospiraceae bacterium]
MSKKSCIEAFIRENREAFDAALPSPHLWEAIVRALARGEQADAKARASAEPWCASNEADIANSLRRYPSNGVTTEGECSLTAFIRQHRDAFDMHVPRAQLWEGIAQASFPSPASRLTWVVRLRLAAAAVILLLVGIGVGWWCSNAMHPPQSEGIALSQISPEYAELEAHFQREIQQKKSRLQQMSLPSSATVWEDLQQMDAAMRELQTELAQVHPANREVVVDAIIKNYKARLAILERVLKYLEQQHSSSTRHLPPSYEEI